MTDSMRPMRPVKVPGHRPWWTILGLAATVALVVTGIAVAAAAVLWVVAISQYGSNK